MFLDRAAEEQRSTVYTAVAAELRMNYEIITKKSGTTSIIRSNELLILLQLQQEIYFAIQYKKRQIQAPGTTFSDFGDDVGVEGHGNC